MTLNEYQLLAARTINPDIAATEHLEYHALHGLVGEVGEIHSLYQKVYQGHMFDASHLKKEIGDLMWFVAELCTSFDWDLDDVARENIDKLRKRYPEGFDAEHSLHRQEGDI